MLENPMEYMNRIGISLNILQIKTSHGKALHKVKKNVCGFTSIGLQAN